MPSLPPAPGIGWNLYPFCEKPSRREQRARDAFGIECRSHSFVSAEDFVPAVSAENNGNVASRKLGYDIGRDGRGIPERFIVVMDKRLHESDGIRFNLEFRVTSFEGIGDDIFETEEKDTAKIAARLENTLLKTYKIESWAIIISFAQLKKVVSEIPGDWESRNDLRRYIAFIREPTTPDEVAREIKPKEGVDFLKPGAGVLYMSTLLSGLTKSGFTKIIVKKVYRDITIRNYTTVQKLLALIE